MESDIAKLNALLRQAPFRALLDHCADAIATRRTGLGFIRSPEDDDFWCREREYVVQDIIDELPRMVARLCAMPAHTVEDPHSFLHALAGTLRVPLRRVK